MRTRDMKVGKRVLVLDNAPTIEESEGGCGWDEDMVCILGTVGTITDVREDCCEVTFSDGAYWSLGPRSLKLAEQLVSTMHEHQFQPNEVDLDDGEEGEEESQISLTIDERDILTKSVDLWNEYNKLPNRAEMDDLGVHEAVIRIQNVIALRVARRANPTIWEQPE